MCSKSNDSWLSEYVRILSESKKSYLFIWTHSFWLVNKKQLIGVICSKIMLHWLFCGEDNSAESNQDVLS